MSVLISLVGEQATPILLPALHLKPDGGVLVATGRTRPIAGRLAALLPGAIVPDEDFPPFDIPEIHARLLALIEESGWSGAEVTYNLTGGTKPMALAAHQVAREQGSGWIYLQSQGARSLLYRFTAEGAEFTREELPTLLTLELFLKAHLGDYAEGSPVTDSEEMVRSTLAPVVDELKTSVKHGPALEIDLVLQCGNQVGIVEVKTGNSARKKDGIDQLTTAAEQRFLGTYTRRFLVIDREMGSNNRELAAAHRIAVVELPSLQGDALSEEDEHKLTTTVLSALGG